MNRLLENRAQSLFDQGLFEEAIEAAQAGVESARRLLMADDEPSVGFLLDSMLIEADIRRHTGFLDIAEGIYRDVLRLGSDYGTLGRQLAFARAGLGDIAEERGQATEALRQYEAAVRGMETVGSAVSEECARLRNNLAMLYKDDHDYQKAEEHLVAGIGKLEASIGRYTSTVATLYSNLAAVYMKVGHVEEAKSVALMACDIRRQILPPGHADTIQSLSNLGAILYALDDVDAAVSAFSEAVAAMEDNKEIDPVDYEVVVSNYIDLLLIQGDRERADEVTRMARQRYQELLRLRATALGGS
jgi:tetratricopeptide (TPR) repeat protein